MKDFLSDVVRDLRMTSAEGVRSKQVRWSESTHRIFGIVKKFGGPRSHYSIKANVGGPDERTTARHWTSNLADDSSHGISDASFIKIASILDDETIPCEVAHDETGIIADITYDQKFDCLWGYCGLKSDTDHKCRSHIVILGDDEETQGKVEDLCEDGIRAPYAQLTLLNPLYPGLPRLAIAIDPTCNTFTHKDVREKNAAITVLFEKHLRPIGCMLSGFSSDGDGRRFKEQKAQMISAPPLGCEPFRISHAGFALHGLRSSSGALSQIHMQDPKHAVKKLAAAMDSHRVLVVGKYMAAHAQVVQVYDEFGPLATGLDKGSVTREDRQNFLGPVRVSGLLVDDHLEKMSSERGEGKPAIPTAGTQAYLKLIREFNLVFFSKKMPLQARIEAASYGINFMRMMRNYVSETLAIASRRTLFRDSRMSTTFSPSTLRFSSSWPLVKNVRPFLADFPGAAPMAVSGTFRRWQAVTKFKVTSATSTCKMR